MAFMIEDKKAAGAAVRDLIVGFQLDADSAQVSFFAPGDEEPSTLAVVEGTEVYDSPLCLARRKSSGQWIHGREAAEAMASGEAEGVGDLYTLARNGEQAFIDGEALSGLSLLTLYIKKFLSSMIMQTAGAGVGLDVIGALMVTADDADEEVGTFLSALCGELRLSLPGLRRVEWVTYRESLFAYLLGQPPEITAQDVLAFWCRGGQLVSFYHTINRHTTPLVANVIRTQEDMLPPGGVDRDAAFLRIAKERLEGHTVSSVYLLGDGFDESWLASSLDALCRDRRVFMGNNLFSRGAAISMRGKDKDPAPEKEEIVFLGPDRVMVNIGIRCIKRGESHYHALIDGGSAWQNARASLELILDKDMVIALEITPLSGAEGWTELLELDGLNRAAGRPRRTVRVSLEITMFSVDRARLSVVDMGFGDYWPSSGEHWERFIPLDPQTTGEARRMAEGVLTEPVLCVGRQAAHPYTFAFLETRVYSAEELCYFLARNDYLLTMDAFTQEFCDWLEAECMLGPLADALRELLKRKCSLVVFAQTILEYIRYCPEEEVSRISQVLRDGDARDGVEKKIKIIEYLIGEQRLSEAHRLILSFDRTDKHPVVLARLLYDEGVIYARLFHYDAAAVCMEKAFALSGDPQVKEAYLAAMRLSMTEEEYIDAIGSRPELSPESLTLESKMGEVLDLFAAGPDNHRINTLQVWLDTGNMRQFDEDTAGAEQELTARYERAMA